MPNPWLILAALALCAAVGWRGYIQGYAAAEHDHNVEKLALIEAARKLDEDRRAAARKLSELSDKLEAEANAEPATVDMCLGPSRVQRLNRTR
jgi:hypothetical protein